MLVSNKYEVESLLGNGSMGEVYKVRQIKSGALSVLKVLPSRWMDHPELLAEFDKEIRVIAKLIHPNIARIIDIDYDDELKFHYFVTEYIRGITLREYLDDNKALSLEKTLSFSRQIASALQLAHQNDPAVIHRTINPYNILLEEGLQRAVLLDFGLTKETVDAHAAGSGTRAEMVRYCPPEQLRGELLSASADLYALGLVMYEAYTGNCWLAGLNEQQWMASILGSQKNEPVFPETAPEALKSLIARAIAKNPADRYRNVGDFISDLEKCRPFDDELKASADESLVRFNNAADGGVARSKSGWAPKATMKVAVEPSLPNGFAHNTRDEPIGTEEGESIPIPSRRALENAGESHSNGEPGVSVIDLKEALEQLKHQMETAKNEADAYNAKENAPVFYGRAMNFQSQGETCLKASSHQEAYENYQEALRIYQDAREFAYFKYIREETEMLSVRTQEAHDEAVKADAKLMAPVLFADAFENEQQARILLSSGDFPQAHRMFHSAMEHYAMALQQVMEQQKQLEMLKARKRSMELWHRAKQACAEQLMREEFAMALTLKEQGQHWEDQQNPERAADYYNQAASAFELLQTKIESLEAREQASIIKEQVVIAQADYRSFRNRAQEAWLEADKLAEKAESAWNREQFPEAKKFYNKALAAYSRARKQSVIEKNREQIQLLKTGLEESRKLAEHCEVGNHCRTLYQKAIEAEAKGHNSQNHRKFQEAFEQLTQAGQYFEQAIAARLEQMKLEIASLQQRARERQVPVYAGALYHKGLEALLAAEELREQARLEQSYDHYRESYRLFNKAYKTVDQKIKMEGVEAVSVENNSRQTDDEPLRVRTENPNKPERSGKSNRYNQFINLDETAANAINPAKVAVGLPINDLTGVNSRDSAHARDNTADTKQRIERAPSGSKRRIGMLGAVVCIAIGGYLFIDRSFIQQWLVEPEPYGEMTLSKVLPPDETVSLPAGKSQVFAIELSGPENKDLAYAWYLDGIEQSQSAQWQYSPDLDGAEAASREVKVVVTNPRNQRLAKIWKVNVFPQLAPGPEPMINHAPKIVFAEPGEQNLSVKPSESVFFTVDANDEDANDELTYSWAMDDKEVSRGTTWLYQATKQGNHEVILTVSDKAGLQDEHTWSISANQPANNHPPRIVKSAPSEQKIELDVGSGINFSAEATDADSKGPISYTWYADRHKQSSSPSWFYRVPSEGQHKISLKVADQEGLHSYRTWYISARRSSACVHVDEATQLCLPDSPSDEGNHQSRMTEAMASGINHPPSITRWSPSETSLEVLLGKELVFSAEGADPDPDDELTYAWLLDGQEQSTNATWPYTLQTVGQHKVILKVADRGGREVHRSWTLVASSPPASCITLNERSELCMPVSNDDEMASSQSQQTAQLSVTESRQNHAPSIIGTNPPGSRLELLLGKAMNFSVEAADPDPDDQLSYSWSLDGRVQSENDSWPYLPQAVGQHKVILKITDRSGKQVQRSWIVNAVSPPAQCITLEGGSELCMPVQ